MTKAAQSRENIDVENLTAVIMAEDDTVRATASDDAAQTPEKLHGSEQAARQVEAVAEIIRARAGHHGDAIEQHKLLAFLWNGYLANPMREKGDRLTAADVAYMLGLLKVSRVFSGGLQKQHVEDQIGYDGIVLAAMESDA